MLSNEDLRLQTCEFYRADYIVLASNGVTCDHCKLQIPKKQLYLYVGLWSDSRDNEIYHWCMEDEPCMLRASFVTPDNNSG